MANMIPFNSPYLTGLEKEFLQQTLSSSHFSGNGIFTKRCQQFFQERWKVGRCFLTTSCTDSLEMCAILLDLKPGDEVIVPSYTFVSSALAFVREGATIRFVDSRGDHPGLDEDQLESMITSRTRAIVAVHYAGVACDMDRIMEIARVHDLVVIEDAAQAIDSHYKGRPLGGIGHLGCFSFHETKNIQCGEGGLLAVNDARFSKRAEIIWEKGTNRSEFFRGEANKYGWVDTGSSFLPNEFTAAFLAAQLESVDVIQAKRTTLWNLYDQRLRNAGFPNDSIKLPSIPRYATNNAHNYYCLARNVEERTKILASLKKAGFHSVFHYLALHRSLYYASRNTVPLLPSAEYYEESLFRLPFFIGITQGDVDAIVDVIATTIKAF